MREILYRGIVLEDLHLSVGNGSYSRDILGGCSGQLGTLAFHDPASEER